MTYTCNDPAPESTCTGPIGATNATSVTFKITTMPATVGAAGWIFDRGMRMFYGTLLPGLLGAVIAARSRRSPRGMRLLGLIIALGFSALWLTSCGGNSNNSTSKSLGTPTGNYSITVNATTGGTSPITGTTTFTLAVQ